MDFAESLGMAQAIKRMRASLKADISHWRGKYEEWRNYARNLERQNNDLQQ